MRNNYVGDKKKNTAILPHGPSNNNKFISLILLLISL